MTAALLVWAVVETDLSETMAESAKFFHDRDRKNDFIIVFFFRFFEKSFQAHLLMNYLDHLGTVHQHNTRQKAKKKLFSHLC